MTTQDEKSYIIVSAEIEYEHTTIPHVKLGNILFTFKVAVDAETLEKVTEGNKYYSIRVNIPQKYTSTTVPAKYANKPFIYFLMTGLTVELHKKFNIGVEFFPENFELQSVTYNFNINKTQIPAAIGLLEVVNIYGSLAVQKYPDTAPSYSFSLSLYAINNTNFDANTYHNEFVKYLDKLSLGR